MRPLAFIDLETTGLDPARHEILEIGVIRVDARTLTELDATDIRVHPTRLQDADPEALRLNGYSARRWENGANLPEALDWVAPLLVGATLAGHNVGFDRAFLEAAWRTTGGPPPDLDHHLLDTATLAWPLLAEGHVDSLSLLAVCQALGIGLCDPHRALSDAERSLEIARRLLPGARQRAKTAVRGEGLGRCRCAEAAGGGCARENTSERSWRCGDGRA